MNDELWVGIDLGTQSVRALAVAADGTVAGSGQAGLDSLRTVVDGARRHEQLPARWWEAVGEATRAALAGIDPARVRGVAVDGTSGTVLVVDDDGRPLTPALMYDDGRAVAEAREVDEVGAATWAALGYSRMQVSWALPKLLWLLRHEPRSRGGRLAHQTDVVTRALVGGPVATDLSSALKTGADLLTATWPEVVTDGLGVPPEMLPPLVTSGDLLGTVGAAGSAVTGLPVGTPVLAGATDGCAAQLGAGPLVPGSWNTVLGTTLVMKGVTQTLLRDPNGVVYSHRGPGGQWLPGGASSTGAGVLSTEFPGADLDALTAGASLSTPADAVTYPLGGHGERFPFVAPEAVGFSLGTTTGDAGRFAAVVQGVALVERLAFDALDLLGAPTDGPVVITGGATRNAAWNQLRADVLGRELRLPDNAEPALGMAVLAAAHEADLVERGRTMVRVRTVLEPDPAVTDAMRGPYVRLVDALDERGWLPAGLADHARSPARWKETS